MSDFYRVSNNLPFTTQLFLLNEMILKLNGLVEQGKFDTNEITALYNDLGSSYVRKYLRDQGLGNTLATYGGWTHFKAEAGYSIWKYAPTTYAASLDNLVYLNNKVLENMGTATAETSQFTKVFFYNGSTYTDDTTEAASEVGTAFSIMDDTTDYLYVGSSSTFAGMKFEFATRGSNYTLKLEYHDSSSGGSWTELTANTNNLVDGTTGFLSSGLISFNAPADWETTTINSQNLYWIRISTTTVPVTTATVYYLTSGDSVEGLLALSSTEALEESYKFCSYNNYVYLTLANAGAASYEGNTFITSASSATNKQNFFIYNNEITADYQDSSY